MDTHEGHEEYKSAMKKHGSVGTIGWYRREWDDLHSRVPMGVFLGPFIVLGSDRKCWSRIFTRIAFWLLSFAGWKFIRRERVIGQTSNTGE